MSKEVNPAGSETPVPETCERKLPYTKPALRCEGVFETMALACGKISDSVPHCTVNLTAS